MSRELKQWTLDMVNQTAGIVLVDFDSTITSGGYNNIGDPQPWVVRFIESERTVACHKVVIWTCRTSPLMSPTPMDRRRAVWTVSAYLEKHGIEVDGILMHPKPHASRYVGDETINPLSLMTEEDLKED